VSTLVTGEAVVLDVRTAALPSRMLAAGLDGLIQLALLLLVFFVMGLFAGGGSDSALIAVTIVMGLAVGLGYPVMFETLMRGRTPGKAALGLRVVRDDAGPIGFRQAFVRGLIGLLVERPGITSFAGAVITSLIDPGGRRLGDMAAGTMVVQERIVAPTSAPVLMPPPLADWAATIDLSGLSDELALSIRSFLARSSALTEAARSHLGGQLAAAVAGSVTPPPPPGTPGWAYLSAVLAERRRREELLHAVAAPAAAPSPFEPAAPTLAATPATPPSPAPAAAPAPTPKKAAKRPAPPPADGFAPPG
jgi:uncharacterized RDD family membrane protein YckC